MDYIFTWKGTGSYLFSFFAYGFIAMMWAVFLTSYFRKRMKLYELIIFSSFMALFLSVFIWLDRHPENITIYRDRLVGQNTSLFSTTPFDIQANEILSIKSQHHRNIGRHLRAQLREGGSKNLPSVHVKRETEYHKSLEEFCAMNGIKFIWYK